MANDKEANKHNYSVWIGLIVVFVLLGVALFLGVKTPEFALLDFGKTTASMASKLDSLSIEYAGWIKPIDSYKDFWGFVCIGGGVLAAIAIALRAPQPVIIIPSAIVAFVLAALQFHSPDKLLEALTEARRSINCLKHPTKELITAEKEYLSEAANTLAHLEANEGVLLEYSVKLTSSIEEITALLAINGDKYVESKKEIYKALVSSDTQVGSIESELVSLEAQAKSIIYALEDFSASDKAQLNSIEPRLKIALNDIQDALRVISLSATLKGQIKADVDKFSRTKDALTLALEKSKADLLNTNYARSQMSDTQKTLKGWPEQLSLSTNLISLHAATVHNDLLLKISKTEPTTQDIIAMVKSVSDIGATPAGTSSEGAGGVNPVRSLVGPKGPREPKASIELSTLEASVSKFESQVAALLEKGKADIERQKVIASVLTHINNDELAMLNSAQFMYQQSVTSVEEVFSKYSASLANTLVSLDKAVTINSKVNFNAINSKIASCSPHIS